MLMESIPASLNTRLSLLAFLLILALWPAVLTGCATNPYTDRSQLVLVTASHMNHVGAEQYQQVLSDPKVTISKDPREVEPVRRVAEKIIQAAQRSKYAESANQSDWQVTVIKDDKVKNAWVLPGGKIAVYTGIFPMAKNEAGLAAIMGHEVVHALAQHGAERMSQQLASRGVLTIGSIALSVLGVSGQMTQLATQAMGIGAQVGFLLPYSRAHESEADYVGLLLAADAGYDPREAVGIWQRMAQASEGQPMEFLSTHPGHETRISDLQSWMPEAMPIYQNAPKAPVANLPHLSPTPTPKPKTPTPQAM
jgi:predicted Zn-dependent protease